jgi:hypothetical protein
MNRTLRILAYSAGALMLTGVSAASVSRPANAGSPSFVEPATFDCKGPAPCFARRNGGSGPGIFAKSAQGNSLIAVSPNGDGVVGITRNPSEMNFTTASGVAGGDLDPGGLNSGVFGFTLAGTGSVGVTQNQSATTGFQSAGVVGADQGGDTGLLNIGVAGESRGIGVFAYSQAPLQPMGQPQYPALIAICSNGGLAMTANDGFVGGDVMSLDCSGNMILKGSLMQNGSPYIATHTVAGGDRVSYGAQQTRPAIEDDGEGRLVDGSGYVPIDAEFGSAIDFARGYSVFITPEGPNQGLYVTGKTGQGFAVHENPGGRSTIAFAYRIVASPVGSARDRLPTVEAATATLYREAAGARRGAKMPGFLKHALGMRLPQ